MRPIDRRARRTAGPRLPCRAAPSRRTGRCGGGTGGSLREPRGPRPRTRSGCRPARCRTRRSAPMTASAVARRSEWPAASEPSRMQAPARVLQRRQVPPGRPRRSPTGTATQRPECPVMAAAARSARLRSRCVRRRCHAGDASDLSRDSASASAPGRLEPFPAERTSPPAARESRSADAIPSRRRTPPGRSAFHRGRSRTPRCPRAYRRLCRVPARDSCTRPFP